MYISNKFLVKSYKFIPTTIRKKLKKKNGKSDCIYKYNILLEY